MKPTTKQAIIFIVLAILLATNVYQFVITKRLSSDLNSAEWDVSDLERKLREVESNLEDLNTRVDDTESSIDDLETQVRRIRLYSEYY